MSTALDANLKHTKTRHHPIRDLPLWRCRLGSLDRWRSAGRWPLAARRSCGCKVGRLSEKHCPQLGLYLGDTTLVSNLFTEGTHISPFRECVIASYLPEHIQLAYDQEDSAILSEQRSSTTDISSRGSLHKDIPQRPRRYELASFLLVGLSVLVCVAAESAKACYQHCCRYSNLEASAQPDVPSMRLRPVVYDTEVVPKYGLPAQRSIRLRCKECATHSTS